VSPKWWRRGATPLTEDQVQAMVTRARADIGEILHGTLDHEGGLARIYAMHGQQPPARPAPAGEDDGGQVQAVCDRIAMLEATLTQVSKTGGPSGEASMYLRMGRQFLSELRTGLAARSLSSEDAFRLLTSVQHDLREAGRTLRGEQRLPLPADVLARNAEMQEVLDGLAGHLEGVHEQVRRLFGHADEPSMVPVP
jgi:hypothetical protein